MDALHNYIAQHPRLFCGASAALLASYCLLRHTLWSLPASDQSPPPQHKLQTSLEELMRRRGEQGNIKRVIITTGASSRGDFRRELITGLKTMLTEEKVKVLINCSPLKILKAGCQCFLDSLEVQDKEYVDYYHAAFSTECLIEDTISSIELINEYDPDTPIIMICDTNPFDLKSMNPDYMWLHYLSQQQIQEQHIKDHYSLVIHVVEPDSLPKEDQAIQNNWDGFKGYHQVKAPAQTTPQDIEQVMQWFRELLPAKHKADDAEGEGQRKEQE